MRYSCIPETWRAWVTSSQGHLQGPTAKIEVQLWPLPSARSLSFPAKGHCMFMLAVTYSRGCLLCSCYLKGCDYHHTPAEGGQPHHWRLQQCGLPPRDLVPSLPSCAEQASTTSWCQACGHHLTAVFLSPKNKRASPITSREGSFSAWNSHCSSFDFLFLGALAPNHEKR